MDNGIGLVGIVIAALAGAGIVYFVFRRNLPPGAAQDLAEAVAYVKDLLSGVVGEAEVRALATWVYRNMKTGSQYYTEEQFVDLVTRAVMRSLENRASIVAAVNADSAFAVTMTQARATPT